MELKAKSVSLIFLTYFCGMLKALPITPTSTLAVEASRIRNPVPVEFVTILAKSVAEPQEESGMFEMPDDPPDWLLHLLAQVIENEHRPVSSRQKRQLDLTDPAVQEILRAYYNYCMYKGCGGTMQVRLGRSVRSRSRRPVEKSLEMPVKSNEEHISDAISKRHTVARSRRSIGGNHFRHFLRHPSFAKFFKHRRHLRGRRSKSIRYNPQMMQILKIYYMRQKGHGTLHHRFG